MDTENLRLAAKFIKDADAILITSGAGMGVDSGFGTFRGPTALVWPPSGVRKEEYSNICRPNRLQTDPEFAWSFWQFAYKSYAGCPPHEGYSIIKSWCDKKKFGGFSYTSNVDGHWKACGFDENRIVECHGTVHKLQCQRLEKDKDCPNFNTSWDTPRDFIWEMQLADDGSDVIVSELPKCPGCNSVARPMVFMFEDTTVIPKYSSAQDQRYNAWLRELTANRAKLVVLEIGAGVVIPTIRWEGEKICQQFKCPLIRVNPQNCTLKIIIGGGKKVSFPFVPLKEPALRAIKAVDDLLKEEDDNKITI